MRATCAIDVEQLAGGSTGPLSDPFAACCSPARPSALLLLMPLMLALPRNSAAADQRRRRLLDTGNCDQGSENSSGTRTVTVARLYLSPVQGVKGVWRLSL